MEVAVGVAMTELDSNVWSTLDSTAKSHFRRSAWPWLFGFANFANQILSLISPSLAAPCTQFTYHLQVSWVSHSLTFVHYPKLSSGEPHCSLVNSEISALAHCWHKETLTGQGHGLQSDKSIFQTRWSLENSIKLNTTSNFTWSGWLPLNSPVSVCSFFASLPWPLHFSSSKPFFYI